MKYNFSFYFLVVYLLFSTSVEAQWVKQTNGLPDTWNLGWAIDASDSNNAIITMGLTGIFKTTDGGALWYQVQLPDTIIESVIDISMPSPSYIWAATDLGKIIASTDGGQNWIVQFNDTSNTNFMNYIEMFDSQIGVAMGDGLVISPTYAPGPALFLRTMDGGANWISVNDSAFGGISGDTWRRLDFVDPMHGYFYETGINPQKLYKTDDGCENWHETNYSGRTTVLKCFDQNIVVAHSIYESNISRTTDGGATWNVSTFSGGWGNDFEFIPEDASKVFFTDGDNLFFSNDTGKTWSTVFVDTSALDGRDIVFTDKNNGWILGDYGSLYKTTTGGTPNYQPVDYIAANEIFMWVGNNGMNSHDPRTDGSGLYWPGGEDATLPAIFADGLVWGGKVNGEIRVNGATYRYGLTPGYIMPNGLPSDPLEVKSKIFKLKKDWQYLPPSAERSRYEFDFLNWPVDHGAPWNDNNGDGVYTLGIDEPKIIGDETLFFVANDLDTATTLFTYGSNPIGLEFQVTTFGYNTELLKDVVFKKYKVINKSNNDITDMYFTYWADDDLGNANDDYEGFDSTLNIGFVFNADNDDDFYYGTPPPTVGHMLVQSPIIPSSSTDSARFGNGWRMGYRNIEMTSSGLMLKSYIGYGDPQLGIYQGTLEFYNMMQGLKMDGSSIINPISGEPTIWPLCGDPVSETGWYEGDGWPGGPLPADRRYHVPTGPFNMAPNDTQEVVIAFLIKKGTDNINSITELKNYAAQIQHWYDNDFVTDVEKTNPTLPNEFSLSQNYPNPFNPSTTINYSLPRTEKVVLKIFNTLGEEVQTLISEYQEAGTHSKLYIVNSTLPSGVYFYRLQAGDFISTKKMVLIK